jgi:ParB family chromosome partitioning protein
MSKKIGKNLSKLLEDMEDARIAAVPVQVLEGTNVYEMDISKVKPNPEQPRKYFDKQGQSELENSIRVHGIVTPLILVRKNENYLIVAGERRYRAALSLGLKTIPAIVKEYNAQKIREISLIENLQREDLNAMEEAIALKELAEMYGLTQEGLAARIGKARSSIANTMRLLSLDGEVQDLVRSGRLSAGHARTLVPIEKLDVQREFAYRACDTQMSVRELETKVKNYFNPIFAPKKIDDKERTRISLELKNMVDDMKRVFATKVAITGNDIKGRIYIDYYSKDDLQRIYDLVEQMKK